MAGVHPVLQAIHNKAGFVLLVKGLVQRNTFAFLSLSPQLFAEAALIIADQLVCSVENGRRRAVVLLELDDFCAGKVSVELLNILNTRAAPAVDGLIVVAYHHQMAAFAGKHTQPCILHGIGILKFVYQNMLETLLIMRQQRRVIQPQFMGA